MGVLAWEPSDLQGPWQPTIDSLAVRTAARSVIGSLAVFWYINCRVPGQKESNEPVIVLGCLNFRSIKVNIKEISFKFLFKLMCRCILADPVEILIRGYPIRGKFAVNEFFIGNIEANSNVGYEVGSVIKRPPPPFVHHCTSSSCLSTLKISVQAGSTIHSLPGACRLKRAV